ncbi:MAG: rhomboid family intramembrane serine protease [Pseudomonadota bacterium]
MFGPKDTRTVVRRLMILAGFVGALWLIQMINAAVGYELNVGFGLIPRHIVGLDGVLGMPFLHVSYPHLVANTPPLLLMGALLALTATRALILVNGIIVVLGGVLVWLLGSHAIHVGASGLVFGWFGFLVARGLVDRSVVTLATSLLIAVVYGSILWGVVPGQDGISWEAHLFGALAGVAAAVVVRAPVHGPRLRDVERT